MTYTQQTEKYFKDLERDVKKIYSIAEEAKKTGLDPVDKVEIPLAMSMAEKVVRLISVVYPQMSGPEGERITNRILELEEQYGKLDATIPFKIAEEISKQKFCKFSSLLEAIDAGIRIGFAYQTIGVVSSPIEGYTGLKLGKTRDGKEYFKAYFSGPIRSAGTTASCIVLMLIDFLRELFGFAKYDPTEEEAKRMVTENIDYHERVSNLQYFPTEEEMEFLALHLPFQLTGEPTERLEVSNYKNLERIETNFLRGGMCLIFSEGLAQKAAKGFRLLNGAKKNGIKSTGFDFLEEYIKLHEKRQKGGKTSDEKPAYIVDLVAGRPVYGHPSRSGAFRFRYGRGRSSGFSATSLHPATMAITDNFIAIGTQLKIEKPTKGCAVTSCDIIDGPIVKLFNGSVKKIDDPEEAKKLYLDVEEIIYLGDILFPFSDVANRNANLVKPGFVEEWWKLELREKDTDTEKKINCYNVDFETAIDLSRKLKIPLHPKYIFYWTEISMEQFLALMGWLKYSRVDKKLIFPFNKAEQEIFEKGKRALELLGIEHEVTIENVVLNNKNSKSFFSNIGLDFSLVEKEQFLLKELISELENKIKEKGFDKVLDIVNFLSEFEIKNKAGEFIGARMGRPEKAKLRKLTGSPNVLFPIGNEGGRLRSLQAACEIGVVNSSFPIFYCEECKKETIYKVCDVCGKKCRKMYYFPDSKEKSFSKKIGDRNGISFYTASLDINHYYSNAIAKLGLTGEELPLLIKGVRGLFSENKQMEHLCKGILRAKYNLHVNKDGTIRFDATELPLVSFMPKEISVSIEKLKEIGYNKDIYGKELVSDEQILELKPHDIILPCCPITPDERADDVFIRICQFIDELLVKFYGLKPLYNIKTREDLIGQLGVFMAPHNVAGVVCRFIGFSKVLGIMASPYMHAAVRRDCDGDEAAVMLLGDVLLNFSREFLPSHRGGTQDAPLVLNAKINAGEVDDQILDFECVYEYPLELYKLAEQKKHSSEVSVYNVKKLLKKQEDPFIGIGFTHNTSDFNKGVLCSSYKLFPTMAEKVKHQMELVDKIRAADTSDTARLIIDRHFMRDMKGNLRKFSMQGFRCVACNEIMRRPPLTGVCPRCRGKIIFTIHEGGIKKYLEPAFDLINRYHLSPYIEQTLQLVKENIDSIFGKELERQEDLGKWFG
jgi:DNA polymerase II large subunit